VTGATLLAQVAAAGAWVITPPAPTVGDSVGLERVIAAAAEVRVRLQPLGGSLIVEPLAEPEWARSGEGVRVRYLVALFEPGRHALEMPPVELLHRDGRVDVIPPDTAWVSVASVLPAGDTLPAPRASLGPVPRYPTRWWPGAVLAGLVLAGSAAWGAARRRVPAGTALPLVSSSGGAPPLPRWALAGEARAVASVVAHRVRARLARLVPEASPALATEECLALLDAGRPEGPVRELADLLRALERARFAPAVSGEITRLVERADHLLRLL
jgi:hypothetical protein